MADTRLTSRRALLKVATGAAAYGAGITLVSIAGVVASAQLATPAQAAPIAMTAVSPDGGRWWRTFERCQRAAAVSAKYQSEVVDPVYERFLAANHGCHFRDTPERQALSQNLGLDPLEDHAERLDAIAYALHERLISLPAPDAKAALWKFNYLIGAAEGDDTGTPSWTKSYMAQTFADVRRFIGGEA